MTEIRVTTRDERFELIRNAEYLVSRAFQIVPQDASTLFISMQIQIWTIRTLAAKFEFCDHRITHQILYKSFQKFWYIATECRESKILKVTPSKRVLYGSSVASTISLCSYKIRPTIHWSGIGSTQIMLKFFWIYKYLTRIHRFGPNKLIF